MKKALMTSLLMAVCTVGMFTAAPARADAPVGSYLADVTVETINGFDCQLLVDLGFVEDCDGQLIVSLNDDGTATANDQNDFRDGFDGVAQGSWTKVPGANRRVTMKLLNFNYDPTGIHEGYQLRDVDVEFSAGAGSFTGNFVSSFFNATQDPLDPAAVPDAIATISLTARRIQ